jgi:hypothetical protein
MSSRIQQLERQIDRVKDQLCELGDLQPGSLSLQFNVCGKPECRCKASPPKKHGPYHYLSFTRKGRGGTRFVRPDHVDTVRVHLENFATLRQLVDQWIDLATELANLKLVTESGSDPKKRARKKP